MQTFAHTINEKIYKKIVIKYKKLLSLHRIYLNSLTIETNVNNIN